MYSYISSSITIYIYILFMYYISYGTFCTLETPYLYGRAFFFKGQQANPNFFQFCVNIFEHRHTSHTPLVRQNG